MQAATRNTRYAILFILIAFVCLALTYSLVTPLFEGPDEIWHYAFADHLANGGGLPVFDASKPATFLRNGAHPPLYYWLVAALIAPIDRSDFPTEYHFNLSSPKITPGSQSDRPNLLVHTTRENFPYQGAVLAGHIARLVSIVLGALTIIGVWQVAKRLLPDHDRLALAATALVAFVPQFVYGAAMINNDALAAVAVTWLLYALLRLADDLSLRWAIISGVLFGVALLSKIGMIAVVPVPAVALFLNRQDTKALSGPKRKLRACPYPLHCSGGPPGVVPAWLKSLRWKQIIRAGLIVYGIAFVLAGWWYIRNWTLYGDPLAWREWQALVGSGRVPPTLADFLHDMLGLFGTFWADFSLRVDHVLVPIFGSIVVLALIGLIWRMLLRDWPTLNWPGLIVSLTLFVLLLASAVRYSFTIYDIHGRLLYPALAVIGVVLALGLSPWGRVSRVAMGGAMAIIGTTALLAPFAIIWPAYAHPIVSALPGDATKLSARYGDVELIGYHLKSDRVYPGDSIRLVTYWRKANKIAGASSLHAVATLVQPDGGLLDRVERTLGTDAYPSLVWQSNEIVASEIIFQPKDGITTVADIRLGVRGSSAQLISSDKGETISLGRVAIDARWWGCNSAQSTRVSFGNQIELTGYTFVPGPQALAKPVLALCWESLKSMETDYTVFVHVFDSQGTQIILDGQPVAGNYPTSAWVSGEAVFDRRDFSLPAGYTIDHISIGLYRLDTGERLPIDGTSETEFKIRD